MRSNRLFLLIVLLPIVTLAQNGRIDGQVKERYKSLPLQNVQVKLIPSNRTAVTDSTGTFVIDGLKPGEYSVIFTKLGYLQYVLPSVTVAADSAKHLQVELDKVPPPVRDRLKPLKQRLRPRPRMMGVENGKMGSKQTKLKQAVPVTK